MVYKLKKFVFYYIKQLFDFNFGRKSQIFTIRFPPAVTLLAIPPAPFTFPLPISGLLASVLTYTFINFIQLLGIGSIVKTYSIFAAFSILALYTLGIRFIFAIHI